MVEALSKKGSVEATTRRFGIHSAWGAVGRSSEIAGTPWDGLEWDPEFNAVFDQLMTKAIDKFSSSEEEGTHLPNLL